MSFLNIILLCIAMFAFGMIAGAIAYSKWIDKPEVQNNITDKRRFRLKLKKNQ